MTTKRQGKLKTIHFIYGFGSIVAAFMVWMIIAISYEPDSSSIQDGAQLFNSDQSNDIIQNQTSRTDSESLAISSTIEDISSGEKPTAEIISNALTNNKAKIENASLHINAEKTINNYLSAWRNKDIKKIDVIWEQIAQCEKCLEQLVDMIVKSSLEEGLMLELAIKMAGLNTDIVLPVFDAIIDPSQNRSYAIILSEKVINNGRPEFVSKIFDVIYRAEQSGYDNFARQLTWVISKLENTQGIMPILDTITGRVSTSPEYATHVSSVFSKTVNRISKSGEVAELLGDYYLNANDNEQEALWAAVSKHGDTLVKLAASADRNGLHYNVDKYAKAIAVLPDIEAVDGLVKLHTSVEYGSDSMLQLLQQRVKDNPTTKVLYKLEDYMRNPKINMDSRIFAAEGLLAVRENRHAKYILEKVIKNAQYEDSELQAYVGGRL